MVTVLFWNRFRDDLSPVQMADYERRVARLTEVSESMPGFVSRKAYTAEDGERLIVVNFEDREALAGWAAHPEHREAQRLGREQYYGEYRVVTFEDSTERAWSHSEV